jgi:hypothetical protein
MMAINVDLSGPEFSFGERTSILDWPYVKEFSRGYDVSLDGRRFLTVKSLTSEEAAPQIIIVQNWFEELKRLVPTD